MIGGRIIEILPMHRAFGYPPTTRFVHRVWCVDDNGDECAVYVMPHAPVRLGDQLWWQGRVAYWTSESLGARDVPLPRFGNSFDPRGREERS